MKPPSEILEFLESGGELDNTVGEAGEVVTVPREEFVEKVLEAGGPDLGFSNANSLLGLGYYPIPVYDILISSEEFEADGLLCWLPTFGQFGTVDMDGGQIYRFPNSTWRDIVEDPGGHIDANWSNHPDHIEAEIVLPWLHFSYHLDNSNIVVEPYPEICPIHRQSIGEMRITEREHEKLLEQRMEKIESWREKYLEQFPCSGMPLEITRINCCSECRQQELSWIR